MTEDERLAFYEAGAQLAFLVPPAPKSLPSAIQKMKSKTERRRAQDAWNAASRLLLLIKIWTHFLGLGLLRARLTDATEEAIVSRFPGLQALGGVLNRLAQQPKRGEHAAQLQAEFDQAHEMKRGPSAKHLNDDPRNFGAKTIAGLHEEFRRLMRVNTECLRLLEVRSELFQRPGKVLLADLRTLTRLNMDFTRKVPRLRFAEALRTKDCYQVRGRFHQAVQELVEQLEAYPEAVLRRVDNVPPNQGRRTGSRLGLTLGVANQKVAKFLRTHKEARSREIAEKIGCSESQVRSTPAWKAVSDARRRPRLRGKRVLFPEACKKKALEKEEERKQSAKAEETEVEEDQEQSPQQVLDRLIADQERDDREDKRQRRGRPR
jgi:hypothetical protein